MAPSEIRKEEKREGRNYSLQARRRTREKSNVAESRTSLRSPTSPRPPFLSVVSRERDIPRSDHVNHPACNDPPWIRNYLPAARRFVSHI